MNDTTIYLRDVSRKARLELTKRALGDVVRLQLFLRKQQQSHLAERCGIGSSTVRYILRAEKICSFSIFIDLCEGLGFDDPCDMLSMVLNQRSRLHQGLELDVEMLLALGRTFKR